MTPTPDTAPTDYRAAGHVSFSVHIKPVMKSPYHSLHLQQHGSADTASRAYLNAGHCLALTPDRFGDEYAVCTMRRDKRTKAYQAFLAEAGDRKILTEAEAEKAAKVADVVRSHPRVAEALAGDHLAEQLLTAVIPGLGPCGGRADLIWFDHNNQTVWWIDLKNWRTNDPRAVANDIARQAWDVQLAWYNRLGILSGIVPERCADYNHRRVTLIACEGGADDPITVGWHEHSDLMCEAADRRLAAALVTIMQCRESGEWPGEHVESEVDPPDWALKQAGLKPTSNEHPASPDALPSK